MAEKWPCCAGRPLSREMSRIEVSNDLSNKVNHFEAASQEVQWPKSGRFVLIDMSLIEQIAWTRETLERLYDLAYLQRSISTAPEPITFRDARELQTTLLRLIQQIKPTLDVPPSSLAWRVFNALEHRYVRALSQTEAAAELN